MAQLTFTQTAENRYEATATVNGIFAVHLKREERGSVAIEVTSVENTDYDLIWKEEHDEIFNRAFDFGVYPAYVKVVSSVEPVSGNNYIVESSSEG